jgi:hypothetical protein
VTKETLRDTPQSERFVLRKPGTKNEAEAKENDLAKGRDLAATAFDQDALIDDDELRVDLVIDAADPGAVATELQDFLQGHHLFVSAALTSEKSVVVAERRSKSEAGGAALDELLNELRQRYDTHSTPVPRDGYADSITILIIKQAAAEQTVANEAEPAAAEPRADQEE